MEEEGGKGLKDSCHIVGLGNRWNGGICNSKERSGERGAGKK